MVGNVHHVITRVLDNVVLVVVKFLHAAKMAEQVVNHLIQRIVQFFHHSAQAVDFLNGRVLVDFKGQLIVMDGVFFVSVIQADPFCHLVVVHRRREPVAYKLPLVVLAKVGNIDTHFLQRQPPPYR